MAQIARLLAFLINIRIPKVKMLEVVCAGFLEPFEPVVK